MKYPPPLRDTQAARAYRSAIAHRPAGQTALAAALAVAVKGLAGCKAVLARQEWLAQTAQSLGKVRLAMISLPRPACGPYGARPDGAPAVMVIAELSAIKRARTHEERGLYYWTHFCGVRPNHPLRSHRWTPEERDNRRAKADPKFRRNLLARLALERARILAAQTAPVAGVRDGIALHEARLGPLPARREALDARRKAIGAPALVWAAPPQIGLHLVPVDVTLGRKVRAVTGREKWSVQAGWTTRVVADSAGQLVWKDSGRPAKGFCIAKRGTEYVAAERRMKVRSIAWRASTQTMEYQLHEEPVVTVTLPDGYVWAGDQQGLKALKIAGGADYHPSANELRAPQAERHIVAMLERNDATRRDMAARAAVEAAQMEGVYVCVHDSLRAGNCLAGTQSFAQRHLLDLRRHYTPQELLAIANGAADRVRLAVKAACLRHVREMQEGRCALAEHGISVA